VKVNGVWYRTIWTASDGNEIKIIDQTQLPHDFVVVSLTSVEDVAQAIASMQVRGAPLIGATAAFGMARAAATDTSDHALKRAANLLKATRPTAVNLAWAVDQIVDLLLQAPAQIRKELALARAQKIADADVEQCQRLGTHGSTVIESVYQNRSGSRSPVNILTHCNAGWLAAVDVGTALAPIYTAFDAGIPVHVWVDETRPRNQGASLTAWELGQHGVPHTIVADNTGGHLMQHGKVDLCIVGTDRTTATGDVCNKVGTYLKALAAKANDIPFYVAAPSSSIDWSLQDGLREIPIEERDPRELSHIRGRTADGDVVQVALYPEKSPAVNYAFDVTPAQLVTGLITERGICAARAEALARMFPERVGPAAESSVPVSRIEGEPSR